MRGKLVAFLYDLLDLFFPRVCVICGETLLRNEEELCLACCREIPRTHYHRQKDNPIEKRFWGKVDIERATSFYFFQKGSAYQQLMHELKYRGNKELGAVLGRLAAIDFRHVSDFTEIDYILPVPLHPQKQKQRGYNQSEWVAKGISDIIGVPLCLQAVKRTRANETQTRKGVYERFQNTVDLFQLNESELLVGKKILLVDDVLTTGATLESLTNCLSKIDGIRINIFTLAVA